MVIATTFSLFKAHVQGWRSLAAAFVMALNKVHAVAVTTILVLHVGVIVHHVRARLRAKGVREALPPRPHGGDLGASSVSPRQQKGLRGRQPLHSEKQKIPLSTKA